MPVSLFSTSRAAHRLEVSATADLAELYHLNTLPSDGDQVSTPRAKRSLAAVAIGSLGLVMGAGVMMASSPTAKTMDSSSMVVDAENPDTSKAEPKPAPLSLNQQVQSQVDKRSQQATTAGGLTAFANKGDSVTRSAVRTELSKAVSAEVAKQRGTTIDKSASTVMAYATEQGDGMRDKELAADQKRIKAEAERIAQEKRKAEERLRKEAAAAKAAAAKSVAAKSVAAKAPKSSGTAAPGNAAAVVAGSAISSRGGAAPIAAGSYSVGASWGQTGSWSRWHTGQDLSAPVGTPVRAVAAGVVGSPTAGGWAGTHVVIHHAGGGSTLSAHLSRAVVSPGQTVKSGQVVGYVGMTGRTFGPHLHFEYYPSGTTPGDVYSSSNPVSFLLSVGVRL